MFEVTANNIADYFRGPGSDAWKSLGFGDEEFASIKAEELAWGVSNIVIQVEAGGIRFVVKQSREKLRTQIDWFSRLDRIWREVDMLKTLARLLPDGSVPTLLFEDRNNYLFAMQHFEHTVWKQELLSGTFDTRVARLLGAQLAAVHRGSTGAEELLNKLGDRTCFDELRLDPFYRYLAQHSQSVSGPLNQLINSTIERSHCVVLADFSPKNILLTKGGPVLVDFETGHFGDPAFDLGFFLSHLLLKAVFHVKRHNEMLELARVFWSRYTELALRNPVPFWADPTAFSPSFEEQCVRHLGACMLSRVDGKSRVDYLIEHWQADLVREFTATLLTGEVTTFESAIESLSESLNRRQRMS